MAGSIDSVSDIVNSTNNNRYFDIVISPVKKEYFTLRVMEDEYKLLRNNFQNKEMPFSTFRDSLYFSSFVEFVGVSFKSGNINPAHYLKKCTSCNYITRIGGNTNDNPTYLSVNDVLEMHLMPDQFSIHGRIEWIDKYPRDGSGYTAGKIVRTGILHDLINESAKIDVEIWGESRDNQYPISELNEGGNYRFEFMKVSGTNTSKGKALTTTKKTKVFAIMSM